MMDQKKVATMTKIAIMENHGGEEMIKRISYRKVDYVLTELFRGFVAGTVCYLLGLVLWFCYLWDSLNDFVATVSLSGLITDISYRYLFFMVIYLVICAIVGFRIHSKSMRQRYQYLSYLRSLKRIYDKDRRTKSLSKDKQTTRNSDDRRRREV